MQHMHHFLKIERKNSKNCPRPAGDGLTCNATLHPGVIFDFRLGFRLRFARIARTSPTTGQSAALPKRQPPPMRGGDNTPPPLFWGKRACTGISFFSGYYPSTDITLLGILAFSRKLPPTQAPKNGASGADGFKVRNRPFFAKQSRKSGPKGKTPRNQAQTGTKCPPSRCQGFGGRLKNPPAKILVKG